MSTAPFNEEPSPLRANKNGSAILLSTTSPFFHHTSSKPTDSAPSQHVLNSSGTIGKLLCCIEMAEKRHGFSVFCCHHVQYFERKSGKIGKMTAFFLVHTDFLHAFFFSLAGTEYHGVSSFHSHRVCIYHIIYL